MNESVEDSEYISKALRGCEGVYNVYMEMVKMAVQYFKIWQRSMSMLSDLALMTVQE